jgi:hypothetical protein
MSNVLIISPYETTNDFPGSNATQVSKRYHGKKVSSLKDSKANAPRNAPRSGKKIKFVSLETFEKKTNTRLIDEPLTETAVLKRYDSEERVIRPKPQDIFWNYKGNISDKTSRPQYVYINDVKNQILFSQTTVSDFNNAGTCDVPLDQLVDSMFIEFKKTINNNIGDGALDLVANSDGTFTSLDNRRLLVAKKIGNVDRNYGIWVKVHAASAPLNSGLQQRFRAGTWGGAVKVRVRAKEQRIFGYRQLPTIMDEGKQKKSQSLPLSLDGCDLSELHPEDVAELNLRKKNNRVDI